MNDIDNTIKELYERIESESGKYLQEYFNGRDDDSWRSEIERIDFPNDETRICRYVHHGKAILDVNFHQSSLGVEFLMPNKEKESMTNARK